MTLSPTTRGLIVGLIASLTFATSGAFIKPLLEAGWSPAAAVTVRAGVAGLVLLPVGLRSLRGKWDTVWRSRWRILGMAVIGVAATQLAYFAAIERIPVSTGLLLEYLAPILLVAYIWARTRRTPKPVVLVGAVVAIGGLVLVIGPGSIEVSDGLGVLFGLMAAIACAAYYLIAASPSNGLPPVTLAAFGLVIASVVLGAVGFLGLVPFTAVFADVPLMGNLVPWWLPIGIVAIVSTAIAYSTSITAAELLGARLMSFVGLLEVVFAALLAWIVIGEELSVLQLLGGALILAGIALVRAERQPELSRQLPHGSSYDLGDGAKTPSAAP